MSSAESMFAPEGGEFTSLKGADTEESEGALLQGCFADVALNRPVRCEFTYEIPSALESAVVPGVRVAVPFGPRREVGVVVGLRSQTRLPKDKLRSLADVLDEEPVIDADLLELTRWMSGYYLCSWGEALAVVLPAPLKRERSSQRVRVLVLKEGVGNQHLAELEERFPKQHRLLRTLLTIGVPVEMREVLRRLNLSDAPAQSLARKGLIYIDRVRAAPDPLVHSKLVRERPSQLSEEQERAVTSINESLEAGGYRTFLLHGVTGSGKTEVYLRVIEQALSLGKGAVVLVPEIALTPQTVGWFRSRFGEVAVLHSRMTDTQRLDMWMRVKRGDARVVVGARSCVFAPVANLGVIVVDEEHEPSFKQSNNPRYNGRDVAVMRARNLGAVCILGSATPSLESWQNARASRYEHLILKNRVSGGRLPRVEVVDMRGEKPPEGEILLCSRRLRSLLEGALERGEQSLLFLNRRGFSPVLWCQACGETVRCANCDLSLNYHRGIRRAVCHSCCEEIIPPKECPSCTAPALRYLGLGSERVEDVLQRTFPKARIERMDSDTMLQRDDYQRVLDAFGRGEVDILVGTQMIAKGLDFPRVTVVGIVSADTSLHLPDFRASERTFQLLSQVAGRAGRGELAGEIVVQTITPHHPAITSAARHDYEAFAAGEIELRTQLGYPPQGRLIRVIFEDKEEVRAIDASQQLGAALRRETQDQGVVILGPAPAPISMVRGRHRHHLLVKAPLTGLGFARARSLLLRELKPNGRPRIHVDVDPVALL